MNNLKSNGLLILVLLIFGSLVYVAMRKKDKTPTRVSDSAIVHQLDAQKANLWDSYVPYIIEDDFKQLTDSTTLLDVRLKKTNFSNISAGKYKIVFRYSFLDCDACIQKVMEELKKVTSGQKIENVIALTNTRDERDFLAHVKSKQPEIPTYLIKEKSVGLYMENKGFPFIFVLTPELRVVKIFIPSREDPDQIATYLKKALRFIYNKNGHAS